MRRGPAVGRLRLDHSGHRRHSHGVQQSARRRQFAEAAGKASRGARADCRAGGRTGRRTRLIVSERIAAEGRAGREGEATSAVRSRWSPESESCLLDSTVHIAEPTWNAFHLVSRGAAKPRSVGGRSRVPRYASGYMAEVSAEFARRTNNGLSDHEHRLRGIITRATGLEAGCRATKSELESDREYQANRDYAA